MEAGAFRQQAWAGKMPPLPNQFTDPAPGQSSRDAAAALGVADGGTVALAMIEGVAVPSGAGVVVMGTVDAVGSVFVVVDERRCIH